MKKKTKTKKNKSKNNFLTWFNNKILLILAGFLIIFIPLYPKLPLFEAIPGYIVRVRLEDIFVFIAALIWLVKAIKKKIKWNSIVFWFIASYVTFAFLSIISAVVLTKTVPINLADKDFIHLAKTMLHFIRYIEYFSLFFIVSSSVREKKDLQILLLSTFFTLAAVSIYGIGQKYLYWPVYSTMNREFSKGIRLYLTEHARVQSTFGGHYDFAAYLVILLNLVLAFYYKINNKKNKIFLFLIYLLGLWSMIVSASRASFISFCVGLVLIVILTLPKNKNLKEKIKLAISRYLVQGLVMAVMFTSFGADMSERLLQAIAGYPIINNSYHYINAKRKDATNWLLISLGLKEGSLKPKVPENSMSLEDLEKKVLVSSDTRPSTTKPSDVYVDVPDLVEVATKSASGSSTTIIVEKERTWSDCALNHHLSICIRLDELWPKAINGFKKNPLLGSGYATLTKSGNAQFTEAESTDNNFLRTLGETGLLGFISFYGLIFISLIVASKFIHNSDPITSATAAGFITASIGLLINAVYIDVFAASKVAFTYWSLTGIIFSLAWLKPNNKQYQKIKIIKSWQELKTKFNNLFKHAN